MTTTTKTYRTERLTTDDTDIWTVRDWNNDTFVFVFAASGTDSVVLPSGEIRTIIEGEAPASAKHALDLVMAEIDSNGWYS